MNVELRSVPDCPNLPATRSLLLACLAELDQQVAVVERIGDYPSPTVLVDGVDVTGAPATGGVGSCRLDLPTAEQIRAALRFALTGAPDPATAGTDVAFAVDCCPPSDPIRTDRPSRAAELPAAIRAVHRQILRHFVATGTPPTTADITEYIMGAGVDAAGSIQHLAQCDLIAIDDTGELIAAYPFSPTPTDHQVTLGSVTVSAMCAIDALGIPAMLDTDAVIRSRDSHTGVPITVTIADGTATFEPSSTVVVYAATGCPGPSVDSCCSTINFFADVDTADAWIDAHPELQSQTLTQPSALALANTIFGPLINADEAATPVIWRRDT